MDKNKNQTNNASRGDRMQKANLHNASDPDSPDYPVTRSTGVKSVIKAVRTPKQK